MEVFVTELYFSYNYCVTGPSTLLQVLLDIFKFKKSLMRFYYYEYMNKLFNYCNCNLFTLNVLARQYLSPTTKAPHPLVNLRIALMVGLTIDWGK